MSVLIKGMDMPTNCRCCDLGLHCPKMQFEDSNRPDDCPLVEVPKHGRLIDGDVLRASFRESIEECRKWANEIDVDTMMYARISQSVGTFVEASLRTKAQPTVIEAEVEL